VAGLTRHERTKGSSKETDFVCGSPVDVVYEAIICTWLCAGRDDFNAKMSNLTVFLAAFAAFNLAICILLGEMWTYEGDKMDIET
jgi:hypothetical protein